MVALGYKALAYLARVLRDVVTVVPDFGISIVDTSRSPLPRAFG